MRTYLTVGIGLTRMILCAHSAGRGVLLMGGTGIAKTALLKSLAKQIGVGYRRLDASVLEPCDLGGIPVQSSVKTGCMTYLRPTWMPDPVAEPEGLLVIEEATRPHAAVKNGLLNLISEKELNGHALPPGWSVHGTANPAGDDFLDAEELDAAFAARFSIIEVRAHRGEWLGWAKTNNVHRDVLDFVSATPTIFSTTGIYERSNPRSWTWISEFLHAADRLDAAQRPQSDEVLMFIAGLVGHELAKDFINRRAKPGALPITATNILNEFQQAYRHRVQRLVQTRQMADLAHLVEEVIDHLLSQEHLQQIQHDSVRLENLACFLNDLPSDMRGQVYQRVPALKNMV